MKDDVTARKRAKRLRLAGLIALTLAVIGVVIGVMWAFGQKDAPLEVGVDGETSQLTFRVCDVTFEDSIETGADLSGTERVYAKVMIRLQPKRNCTIKSGQYKLDGNHPAICSELLRQGQAKLRQNETYDFWIAFETERDSSRNLEMQAYGYRVRLGSSMQTGGSWG